MFTVRRSSFDDLVATRAIALGSMARRRSDELTVGECAVLALVNEGATHGFAIAQALAPEGPVGQVWAMPRPLVYRALDVLASFELTQAVGTEASSGGPRRTLVEATPEGAERIERWLWKPIGRVRDTRSDLMLKLLFLHRRGADPTPLLTAQRERFAERVEELRAGLEDTEEFGRTVILWRIESTEAAIRFVDALAPANL